MPSFSPSATKPPLNVTPTKEKVAVIVGSKIDIPYKLKRLDADFKGNFQVQTAQGELPAGITVNNLNFTGKDEQTLTVTTLGTLTPGTYSLVLRGFAPIAPPKGKNVNTILPTAALDRCRRAEASRHFDARQHQFDP